MKNSSLSLTLLLLVVFFLASCASNNRHIGCYGYEETPDSDAYCVEEIDLQNTTEVKMNTATESLCTN
jgi:PBP1b-binding outer membrane lipoprotein LpoB